MSELLGKHYKAHKIKKFSGYKIWIYLKLLCEYSYIL